MENGSETETAWWLQTMKTVSEEGIGCGGEKWFSSARGGWERSVSIGVFTGKGLRAVPWYRSFSL